MITCVMGRWVAMMDVAVGRRTPRYVKGLQVVCVNGVKGGEGVLEDERKRGLER